jgi:hypothetical protein
MLDQYCFLRPSETIGSTWPVFSLGWGCGFHFFEAPPAPVRSVVIMTSINGQSRASVAVVTSIMVKVVPR